MRNGRTGDESSLVVIGASAGGIEALERLLAGLPEDFPAPIVIAQHADPKFPSHLAQILRRHTPLKIIMIDDREEELAAGTVYLVPAGKNLGIRGMHVVSTARRRGHPIPWIDALFISAAESYGDRVIAVILTGMGTDGVSGVRAVKEHGGTVLVQEPESAAYPALPAAIPLNHIDFTANLESLPSLLTTLAASHGLSSEIANPEMLRAFLNQLRSRSGIDFRQYKTPTIVRRLSRLMAGSGLTNLADYLRHLAANPDAYHRLVSTFLIKVTEFFRDPALFALLREKILPELIEHARKTHSELRLWSAGCATGEEAYSLAIAVAELLGDEIDTMPIRIFATDLDADAIAFARRGLYPASALKEIPAEMVAKYFTHVDDAYQVKKRIRNLTVFGEYDLGQRAPFPRIDLVLCRNVLIYFTKELQQRTLQLFAFSLRGDGYLVLGKAETTSPVPQFFATINPTLKIYRRQGERLLIPAPAMIEGPGAPAERPSPRRLASRSLVPLRRLPGEPVTPRWSLVDRLGAFLFDSPIGVAVVDRNYDILTINQRARVLLGIRGQGIGDDIVHLAEVPAGELKAALDAAFRNEMPSAERELEVRDALAGERRFLQITCYPDRTVDRDGRVDSVFVIVVDVTKSVSAERQMLGELEKNRATLDRVSTQSAELIERQHALINANNELTTANAELRGANEHLLIAAEEAEASAEEVETLNEEMQATSEELETLNEELQATVEELNTTNEELAARGNELEQLARGRQEQLEAAQHTLATLRAVVEQTPLVVCLVDGQSKVAIASHQYVALAESNGDSLPRVGETWRNPPKTVRIAQDGERQKTYVVQPIPLPQDGSGVMLVLDPQTR